MAATRGDQLTIRSAQLRVLAEGARSDFENRMMRHLAKYFPEKCEGKTESTLLEEVRKCVQSAGENGIVKEQDVCLYTDALIISGQVDGVCLPWAIEIMRNSAKRGPSATASLLYDVAFAGYRPPTTG